MLEADADELREVEKSKSATTKLEMRFYNLLEEESEYDLEAFKA